MQTATQPPGPPATATAPAGTAVPTAIRIEGISGVPTRTVPIPATASQIREVRTRRTELLDQLTRAQNRRANVVESLEGAVGANRAGLESRLALMDQRIVQLEAELAATEQAVANAPASALVEAGPYSSSNAPDAAIIIPGLLTVFVGFPLAIAYARRIWKRTPPPRVSPADAGRLERIEQAVEAIAVEVERVSEGQRFVTKLMSDDKLRITP